MSFRLELSKRFREVRCLTLPGRERVGGRAWRASACPVCPLHLVPPLTMVASGKTAPSEETAECSGEGRALLTSTPTPGSSCRGHSSDKDAPKCWPLALRDHTFRRRATNRKKPRSEGAEGTPEPQPGAGLGSVDLGASGEAEPQADVLTCPELLSDR